LGGLLFQRAQNIQNNSAAGSTKDQALSQYNDPQQLQTIAYVLWAILAISILVLYLLWGKIRLAISILKASAEFVEETPSALALPPVMFLVLLTFIGYWIWIALYLYSSGTVAGGVNGTPFPASSIDAQTQNELIFHGVGLFWGTFVLVEVPQFIISSAVCIWYFSGATSKDPIAVSVWRTFRYHLGSIALGSVILTITCPFRVLLSEFHSRTRGRDAGNNPQARRFCGTCCSWLLDFYERFIGHLTKHAYIHLAMTGQNFFPAAWDSANLMFRNAGRFSVTAGIGHLFTFLGEMFISLTVTLIGYTIITNNTWYQQNLHSPVVPTVCFAIISYVIGSNFMSVYGIASDAILHCYCMDEEMNASAINAKKSLHDFMKVHVAEREGLLKGPLSA